MKLVKPTTDSAALWLGGDRIRLLAAGADGEPVVLRELDGRYWCFETTIHSPAATATCDGTAPPTCSD